MGREVFVFGSNRQGRHGLGAAKRAVEAWGAVYGQPWGRQGNSYAIVTKELRADFAPVSLQEIRQGIWCFRHYALAHPDVEFLVSRLGSGLAGYSWELEIKPLFGESPPPNITFLEDRLV